MRTDVETSVLRTPGMLYQEQPDGRISNLYNIKIINKTNYAMPIRLELMDEDGTLQMVGNEELQVDKQGVAESALFLMYERADIHEMKSEVTIGVYSGDKLIEEVDTYFLGPGK
jgi:outer membrane lipoprotein-sorting protein